MISAADYFADRIAPVPSLNSSVVPVEIPEPEPPYPWCHGSPTKADCARRGYCNRDPNCGE